MFISTGVQRTIRKKQRKTRTTFTTHQLQVLEINYIRNKYIDAELRQNLANSLNIDEKCIKVWFQNRRMKEKRESSEASSNTSSDILNTKNSQETTEYDLSHHIYNSQYIVPDNYTHDTNQVCMQNYNFYSTQTVPTDNNAFHYDVNNYPTQYYPNYCVDGTSVDQYNTQGSEIQHYWSEIYSIGYV